jgi:hypothetical protein
VLPEWTAGGGGEPAGQCVCGPSRAPSRSPTYLGHSCRVHAHEAHGQSRCPKPHRVCRQLTEQRSNRRGSSGSRQAGLTLTESDHETDRARHRDPSQSSQPSQSDHESGQHRGLDQADGEILRLSMSLLFFCRRRGTGWMQVMLDTAGPHPCPRCCCCCCLVWRGVGVTTATMDRQTRQAQVAQLADASGV